MLRALAESGRISNLPTVWTNVLVGAAIAGWTGEPGPLVLAMLAVSLLYLGGMILNDVLDAEWDRAHKRGRPIASGRLRRSTALWISVGCMITGVLLAASRPAGGGLDPVFYALALVACIVLYDWLHKRWAWTVVLMAGCRALVYPLAASLVSPEWASPAWPASAAIGVYTILLTLAARRENERGAAVSRLLAWVVPAPYLVAASAYFSERLLWTSFVAAAFFAWTTMAARAAIRGRIPAAVLGWLAGMCLGDALLLMLLNRLDLAGYAVLGWLVTVVAHRRISGT